MEAPARFQEREAKEVSPALGYAACCVQYLNSYLLTVSFLAIVLIFTVSFIGSVVYITAHDA